MFTILSIEDDMINVSLMRRYLKAGDFQLIEATNGKDGIQLAHDMQPDLILLDIHLPDMNGRDVLARIRELPDMAHIPVIALTADNARILQKQTLSEGFDAHLTKPVSVGTLLGTMQKLLPQPTERIIA